ncbi:LysE family translocator [Williamwhitmania taraxaci]|uniref:Threonine/homoserine/homoserine lactone efflux protein n=1 Tax=Williamwhitmania taraxaci TaxID=1640674 RepID=A0A1G6HEZ1_9BACT|nr:LysE family transporter [Williamwhitmania taraxaci]SDB92016.1 Threonine/homoserine/homoserine lactone efflux protein [Williamwhitmania taraxaci]
MGLVLLIKGIIVGLLASIPLGPIGVICIQRTINKGRLSGFMSGIGAATADTIFATIAGFSLTFIINFIEEKQFFFQVAGGFIVMALGISIFYTNPIRQLKRHRKNKGSLIEDYLSVLFLTITNPLAVFLFIGLFATLRIVSPGGNVLYAGILLSGVFIGAAAWWLVLSTVVNRFRARFRLKQLWYINKISGGVIFILGLIAAFETLLPFFANL